MDHRILAVGGLGGSGTRVVASILQRAGIHIGENLNVSLDNLTFTHLFKNPAWYKHAAEAKVDERLSIFASYMSGNKLSFRESMVMYRAAIGNSTVGLDVNFVRHIHNNTRYLSKHRNPQLREVWAWKEPNTQVYVEKLLRYFKDLRYVHVMRHGVDMAFSKNVQQLKNWAWKYGVDDRNYKDNNFSAQLDFWIATTKEVQHVAAKYSERVLCLTYEELCNQPKAGVRKLLDFCEIETSEVVFRDLCSVPDKNKINRKYYGRDLHYFSPQQLEEVQKLGYDIHR